MDSIIYIVDDDIIFSEVLKRKLLIHGFTQVYTCHTGSGFLLELNVKPDLIFLDYDLGDLTGIEVLLKIKKYSPKTEVIMVSAQEKYKIIEEAKSLGVYRYIAKGQNQMNAEIEEALSCLAQQFN